MLLIWKEYFTHVILCFSSPRCAIIAHPNVIYTKFWHVMIAQLNKIWRVWAYGHAIACHLWPDLYSSIIIQLCFKYPESFPSSLFCQLNLVKGGTLFYIDQNLKYKVRGDLNIFIKSLIESTFIEIMNTKQKNMIIGCIYKHPKLGTRDFNENYILPLMDKLSREKKDIPDHGWFQH